MPTNLAREYLSGSLASSFTYALFSPLEVVKTRLQIQDAPGWQRIYHGGLLHTSAEIMRKEGLLRFWCHGLTAGIARDFAYSGIRTGMYPTTRDAIAAAGGKVAGAEISLVEKIAAGAATGSVGAGLANSFDVVRVRMICDGGRVDPATRRLTTGLRAGEAPRWSSSFGCMMDAARSEGVARGLLLRGIGASMARAGVLTAAQMATYDHTKTVARRHGISEGPALHVAAALLSGLAAAAACNPTDVLKSRIMSSGGRHSTLSMAWHILTREGVAGFYRGFQANYARLGPTILVQLPIVEQLRLLFGVRAL